VRAGLRFRAGVAAAILGLLPVAAGAEGWALVDPAPGRADVARRIEIQSTAPLPCGMFQPRPAVLSVACLGPTVSVTLETTCILAPLGGADTLLRYRLDAGGESLRRFRLIGGGRSLQLAEAAEAEPFLAELLTAERLSVQVPAANRVESPADFPLSGFEPALVGLRAACGGEAG